MKNTSELWRKVNYGWREGGRFPPDTFLEHMAGRVAADPPQTQVTNGK